MSLGGNPKATTVALFSSLFTGRSIIKNDDFFSICTVNPLAPTEIVVGLLVLPT